MTEEEKVKHITTRLGDLEKLRQPWESTLFQPVIDYIDPHRMSMQIDNITPQKIGTYIYDGTPQSALQIATDGYYGNLVSPKLNWIKMNLPISVKGKMAFRGNQQLKKLNIPDGRLDKLPEIKMWLEDCTDVMYSAYRKSNFYSEIREWFNDYLAFGTPCIYIEEDVKNQRIVFSVRHPGEVYFDKDFFGNINTIYRKIKLTARDCANEFGESNLPDNIKKAYENNRSDLFDFLHCVEPRVYYDTSKVNAKNKPWADIYLCLSGSTRDKKIIQEGGHNSNPYTVGRTVKRIPNTPYCYSVCMEALVTAITLNQVGKDMLNLSHVHSQPPWWIPMEMKETFDNRPNAQNYYDDPTRIPFQQNIKGKYPIGIDQITRLQDTLEDLLMVKLFLMFARIDKPMTATEALQLAGEKATNLSPQIFGMENGLDRMSDAVFEIELNAGRMPPLPPILYEFLGERIDFEFMGPLSQLQKRLVATQSISSAIETIAPILSIEPNTRFVVKWEDTVRELLETNGMPTRNINTKEEYAAIMGQMQQQAAVQQAMQGIDVAGKAVQRGSREVDPGSPVAKIMEAMGGEG